jgi:hypothetical protein
LRALPERSGSSILLPVRDCQSSEYGDLGPDREQRSLRAGPIAFVGMAEGYPAEAVARTRNPAVTMRVVQPERESVALSYLQRAGWEANESLTDCLR